MGKTIYLSDQDYINIMVAIRVVKEHPLTIEKDKELFEFTEQKLTRKWNK